ncbi:unnamed protein product [Acanthosepion pharaonis]|uniref:Uncharacterized protein n=1 Tax=Acanthosepion pharaonis TaxID=158019 RepID=A0A812AYL1_ACAPH|nr:unnamed protein product [Sepia pharaonis]
MFFYLSPTENFPPDNLFLLFSLIFIHFSVHMHEFITFFQFLSTSLTPFFSLYHSPLSPPSIFHSFFVSLIFSCFSISFSNSIVIFLPLIIAFIFPSLSFFFYPMNVSIFFYFFFISFLLYHFFISFLPFNPIFLSLFCSFHPSFFLFPNSTSCSILFFNFFLPFPISNTFFSLPFYHLPFPQLHYVSFQPLFFNSLPSFFSHFLNSAFIFTLFLVPISFLSFCHPSFLTYFKLFHLLLKSLFLSFFPFRFLFIMYLFITPFPKTSTLLFIHKPITQHICLCAFR